MSPLRRTLQHCPGKEKSVSLLFIYFCIGLTTLLAQAPDPEVKHANPVYDDLITELGAGKGANEINVNLGYRSHKNNHHLLLSQLELEYAPADNLGVELTLPYTAYFANPGAALQQRDNRIEFLQWGAQYTFYSSVQKGLTFAFKNTFGKEEDYDPEEAHGFAVENIRYLPLLVAAKNWHDSWFLLFAAGSELSQDL